MDNILITGASGFIGKNLINKLDLNNVKYLTADSQKNNLIKANCLNEFAGKVNKVVHLASKTFVPDSWENPLSFYETNVTGTLNVLEFCRKNNASLVYISAYLYGIPSKLPIEESEQLRPNNPYAHSKYLAENACDFYSHYHNVPIVILRPFNIYGPFQSKKFLISQIISDLLEKEEIIIKDLSPKRDYLHVDDFNEAVLKVLDSTFKPNIEIYNVGSGRSYSIKEVIDTAQSVIGSNKKVINQNIVRPNEILDTISSTNKIFQDFGWECRISLRDGIASLVQSMNEA